MMKKLRRSRPLFANKTQSWKNYVRGEIMKKSKKLFSVLICFSMIFSSLSATIVTSAETKTYSNNAESIILNEGLILSPGDLNGDGNFNAFDIVLMKKSAFWQY